MTPTHDDFDKQLDRLVASTRSPRGRFSARNSWNLLEKRISPPAKRYKWMRMAGAVAASILLCVVSWHAYDHLRPATMQTVSARAEVRLVTLPDRTEVTLNRYSSLTYPDRFKGEKREVQLTGEAYFEVEKDAEHPFVVKAEQIDVQVLGTHFNVDAYPGDAEVRTTLLEGSVAVGITGEKEPIVLLPGESAVYNRTTNRLQREQTPESVNKIVWRSGDFLFDYLPLHEITRQLAHAFHVTFEITDPALKSYRIRAHFGKEESLAQILGLLQETGNFRYAQTDSLISIYPKQQ